MRYYLGIDAGGTKTHCYVGDESGTILGEGFGGQGNYQLCGADVARISYESAINEALSNAGLHLTDITYAVFGLSGADEEVDFEVLRPLCKSIVGDIPHEILNDTWIGLRTGAKHGVVSICGTGAAHAGKNRDGQKHILRNLHYELGNMGGGGEVVDQALHYAFRSNEGTYKKTKLEQAIMDIFEAKTMDEVCNAFRTNDYEVPREQAYHIPIATMKLASEGDEVAKEIISNMGREEGRYAAGVIKALGMENDEVPLVLIGSMFATGNPLLLNPYLEEAKKVAPKSHVIVPTDKPVLGALKLAVEANVEQLAST